MIDKLPEFRPFVKIPRLSREICITEKIDGTNGVIYIDNNGKFMPGSRTRWLDEHTDNHGFYHWAMNNMKELKELGPGYHFGEWWGSGIQRGYGLPKGEKRFSLFNTHRWYDDAVRPKCCHVVPILHQAIFDTNSINACLDELRINGSHAAPGFMNPEGIVIFHKAGNMMFKKTLIGDDSLKENKYG